jgi:predicted DsbA family dithiol-disulfide isomerase
MKFSDQELELLAWFIGKHWNEFFNETEDIVSINALHRLAEKLGLNQSIN